MKWQLQKQCLRGLDVNLFRIKKNLASMDHGGVDNDCNIDDDNDGGFSGGGSGDSKDGELINFYLFNIIILCN